VNRSKAVITLIVLASLSLAVSCGRDESKVSPPDATSAAAKTDEVPTPRPGQARKAELVVEEFGRRMKDVPTTAAPDVAAKAIREKYSGLVDKLLVESWAMQPNEAPGRPVSSPWPDRIEITSSTDSGAEVVVIGTIVEVSGTGEARRVPVEIRLRPSRDEWVISAFAPLP
jgi:hypothetical protein